MIVAHVGGVPVEEVLPALAGTGTGLLVARAWLAVRLRRRRGPDYERQRFTRDPAASPAGRSASRQASRR